MLRILWLLILAACILGIAYKFLGAAAAGCMEIIRRTGPHLVCYNQEAHLYFGFLFFWAAAEAVLAYLFFRSFKNHLS
ncbi:MAG: hypothetical protein OEZ34_17330 [Spirochaetia bacterium]|nr:hypothetical protein [Spirochaetia bacterium]